MKKKKVIALRILGAIFFLVGIIAAMIFFRKGFATWIVTTVIIVGIVGTERLLHYANQLTQRRG